MINGDMIFYQFDNNPDKTHDIYMLDHETMSLYTPVAKSLSSWMYFNCLYACFSKNMIDESVFVDGIQRLEHQIQRSWHYDHTDIAP